MEHCVSIVWRAFKWDSHVSRDIIQTRWRHLLHREFCFTIVCFARFFIHAKIQPMPFNTMYPLETCGHWIRGTQKYEDVIYFCSSSSINDSLYDGWRPLNLQLKWRISLYEQYINIWITEQLSFWHWSDDYITSCSSIWTWRHNRHARHDVIIHEGHDVGRHDT